MIARCRIVMATVLVCGTSLSAFPAADATTPTVSVSEALKDAWQERWEEYRPWIEGLRKRTATEVEKLSKWEYRVVRVKGSDSIRLTEVLNKWGSQGWECFHVVSSAPAEPGALPGEHLLFLRKRPKSWLNQVPLRELLRVLFDAMRESGAEGR